MKPVPLRPMLEPEYLEAPAGTLIGDIRRVADAGRRFSRAFLAAVGLAPCTSCDALPWECCCPMSVRQRNGWEHDDLNNLHGGRPHVRGGGHHVPDAGRELLALLERVKAAHAEHGNDIAGGWMLEQVHAAVDRAGLTR